MGFVDMVVETGLQPYDVQALIPLVEAAGGVITDWSGGPCDQGGDVFACGDRGAAREGPEAAGISLVSGGPDRQCAMPIR